MPLENLVEESLQYSIFTASLYAGAQIVSVIISTDQLTPYKLQ